MKMMNQLRTGIARSVGCLVLLILLPLSVRASEDPLHDTLQEFFEFADYVEGVISVEQLLDVGLDSFLLVDTRLRSQFEKEHLPGAIHVEWREVVAKANEFTADRPVVLYCDTGLLSSRAHLALRLLSHDNVKVLFGGLNEWKMHQGIGSPGH